MSMLNRQRRIFSGFKRYLAQTADQSIGVAPMSFFVVYLVFLID